VNDVRPSRFHARVQRTAAGGMEQLLYAGAMVSAVVLVVAHLAPWSIVRPALAAAFTTWVAGAMLCLVVAGWTGWQQVRRGETAASALVVWGTACLAIAFGAMREIHLGVLQLFGNTDLTYNIDHRFIFMHAWSIIRYGGLSESLAMAGQPINYHTGPSWYAAAVGSLLDADPRTALFVWFPIAAMVTIVVATLRILRSLGIPPVAAAVGVAFAATPSWAHIDITAATFARARFLARSIVFADWAQAYEILTAAVLNSYPTTMLNALLGTAIVLAAVSYFSREQTLRRFATAAVIIAFAAVAKPQYVAGGPPLLMAVGLSGARQDVRRASLVVGFSVASAVGGLVLSTSLFGDELLLEARISPDGLAWPQTWRAVRPFLPTQPSFLFAVGVLAVLSGLWVAGRVDEAQKRIVIALAVLLASMVTFWFLLSTLVAGGGPELETWAWNAMQGVGPMFQVSVALSAAAVASLLRGNRTVLTATVLLVVGLGALATVRSIVEFTFEPIAGHEAADAPDVRALLLDVDPASAVIMVSDLSDPAQDHRRSGRAFYLSNAFGHQFWLTQAVYGHQLLPETAVRVAKLDRFFETEWSSWHVDLLSTEGLTHVMISGRCPSVWDPDAVPMLTRTAATGGWDLYEVAPPSAVWTLDERPRLESGPASNEQAQAREPLFGRASCR